MSTKKFVPIAGVCRRYDRSDRTIDRWVEAGELPPPIYIRRNRYWDAQALDERDAARGMQKLGDAVVERLRPDPVEHDGPPTEQIVTKQRR